MPRNRTNYNRISEERQDTTPQILMKVKEKESPVRIRAGAGTNYSHVDGRYLGSGIFEIVEIESGPGSKSGWGRLANGDGWVALDFVERVG